MGQNCLGPKLLFSNAPSKSWERNCRIPQTRVTYTRWSQVFVDQDGVKTKVDKLNFLRDCNPDVLTPKSMLFLQKTRNISLNYIMASSTYQQRLMNERANEWLIDWLNVLFNWTMPCFWTRWEKGRIMNWVSQVVTKSNILPHLPEITHTASFNTHDSAVNITK